MKKQVDRIPADGLDYGTHLDVEVYYDKGGRSFISGVYHPRGYYLRVMPVKVDGGRETWTLFSGSAKLLFETNRYSRKQAGLSGC